MGTRGLFILLDDREDVLDERKHEEVGLWTQTLLARDVLDGWSGLRPYKRLKTWNTTWINKSHTYFGSISTVDE